MTLSLVRIRQRNEPPGFHIDQEDVRLQPLDLIKQLTHNAELREEIGEQDKAITRLRKIEDAATDVSNSQFVDLSDKLSLLHGTIKANPPPRI